MITKNIIVQSIKDSPVTSLRQRPLIVLASPSFQVPLCSGSDVIKAGKKGGGNLSRRREMMRASEEEAREGEKRN